MKKSTRSLAWSFDIQLRLLASIDVIVNDKPPASFRLRTKIFLQTLVKFSVCAVSTSDFHDGAPVSSLQNWQAHSFFTLLYTHNRPMKNCINVHPNIFVAQFYWKILAIVRILFSELNVRGEIFLLFEVSLKLSWKNWINDGGREKSCCRTWMKWDPVIWWIEL